MFQRLCVSMLAVSSLALTAGVASPHADASATSIYNFGRINQNYYRGAQPTGTAFDNLAGLGVKTVIDLTGDEVDVRERSLVEGHGMAYIRIPMTTHQPPTSAKLEEFLAAVRNPANQPVYVHCVNGRHRTGVMTAVYRMDEDGWSADDAYKEMKRYRFGADILHPEFKNFVFTYGAAHRQTSEPDAARRLVP